VFIFPTGRGGPRGDTLRQAIAGGYESFGWMKHDPDLNAVRDHPEFIAMLDGR